MRWKVRRVSYIVENFLNFDPQTA